MSYFFASIFEAFLPTALFIGLNWLSRPAPKLRTLTLALLGSLAAGLVLAKFFDLSGSAVLLTYSAVQAVFIISALALQKKAGLTVSVMLALSAAFFWGHDPNLKILTASRVVNTDLLVAIAVIISAFLLLVILACQLKFLIRLLPRLRRSVLSLLALLLFWPLAGNVLLGLMKQEVIELTGGRLRLVALIGNFPWAITVAALLVVSALLLLVIWRKYLPLRRAANRENDNIARRKLLAEQRHIRRLAVTLLLALFLTAGIDAYWYQVASKPLKISHAQRIELNANGELRLPYDLATLADGKLRRFDWLADDGKVVRFFVINRFDGTSSPTVVFDACMLCGDMGYAQEADQVVCIACGVRLYPPTIGNPGGCNPIPMEGWRIENNGISIPRASLEMGARYFTTVEEVKPAKPAANSGKTTEAKPCCGG